MHRALKILATMICVPTFLAACGADETSAGHAEPSEAAVVVADAWVRAMPPGAPVAGGYFTLTNTTAAPLRLVGVETSAAPRVEIHEMRMADGVMQMRELGDGLVLDPGQPVKLAPGGIHLMLMDPSAPLAAGDEVVLRLVFDDTPAIDVTAPVKTSAPDSGHAAHH